MKDLATRCAGREDVLPHVSTRNIARDMDVVRAALGEKKVSYLGVSYGSYLGAVYTQMFPDRADRVVIDSALDPDAYGPDLTRGTAPAEAAALTAWAGWVAHHHGQYGLGATTGQVLNTVDRIRRAAARGPLTVGTHTVEATMLPLILSTSIGIGNIEQTYATFSATIRVLSDAARGSTVTPTPDLEQILALYSSQEPYDKGNVSALVSRCADRAASRSPQTYWRDIQAHRADEPLFGAFTRNITPCAFWPTDPAEPPTKVDNDVPTLIVGADGDTITHLPGQLNMHRALTGSRMVTLTNAHRHAVFLFEGNACIDATVKRYLLDGVLPDTDTTCTRPRPER
jgi:pimeloyl-ACP methyl ester carboxylesterase